jgi:S1-C subfamily serine protease
MMGISAEKLKEIHRNILYPIVRVLTEHAAGTGVVIYSAVTPETIDKPDEDKEYESYVVTCHHVVEEAIKFVKKWSSISKKDITVEANELVRVELFKYEKLSRCIGGTTLDAEIVAYDKPLDVALLKVKCSDKVEHVAKLFPREKGDDIKLGTSMISCGCSMAHNPFFTFGSLTSKGDQIEAKEYWMTSANIIFGNSGGPVFLEDTYEYIGNTARVASVQLGFGVDIITWMGFFIPIDSIYRFLEENFFQFVYDKTTDSKKCAELRKAKMEEEERKMSFPAPKGSSHQE